MRILVSGGGTGGHIYPALALIDEAKKKDPTTKVLYVGTNRGLESRIVPDAGIDFKTIEIQGFKRSLSLENFKTVYLFLKSIHESKKIIKEFKPDIVVGTGGYVCGSVVFAAAQMHIPTVIHEQNSVAGVTNKFLSHFVDKVAICFDDVRSNFPENKIVFTGNPRAQQVAHMENKNRLKEYGLKDNYLTVLIFGGSRGAEEEIEKIFAERLKGIIPDETRCEKFYTAFMLFVSREYARREWVMQIHFGCRRNNNTRMYIKMGADTGFDCIASGDSVGKITDFLDDLNETGELPKTILYSLNPNDDSIIDSVIGCYQDASVCGKLQHGSAWWFNDHYEGMRNQMKSLASQGALASFVGMLTDSRSFLSYTRHEYFRRILCGLFGEWIEAGMYPKDWDTLGEIVKNICYNDAVTYFNFPLDRI